MSFKNLTDKYAVPALLLSIILFITLPYGSVEYWSRNLVYILCFIHFIAVIKTHGADGFYDLGNFKYEKLSLIIFFLVLIFQTIPLPEGILGFIGSGNLEIWRTNRNILDTLGNGTGQSSYTISLYPYLTWKNIIELCAYFAFGYSVSRVCGSERRMKLVLLAVFLVVMLQSITGIIQFFSSGQGFASGTYVNRNHYAGLLELSVFILIGYVLSLYRERRISYDQRNIFARYLADDNFIKQLALIFVLSMTAVSLFLSFSRMGIISFLTALTFMHLVYKRFSRDPVSGNILIVVFIVMGFAYVVLLGLHPLLRRFLEIDTGLSSRFHVWMDSLSIVADFPVFGTGLGTFGYIYPSYKTLEKAAYFNFAHNDYIQLMVETGLAGFISLMIPLVLFIRHSIKRLKELSLRQNQFIYLVKLGALGSVVSVLVHSLADFNLHIPANAIFFSLMIGIILSDDRS